MRRTLMPENNRKLRVFLCHASQDSSSVHKFSQRLNSEGWINSWFYEEEKQLSQIDRKYKIKEWLESAVVVLVCFSSGSLSVDGDLNQETIDYLDVIDKELRDPVLIIPVRFDDCPVPKKLKKFKRSTFFLNDFDGKYKGFLRELKIKGRRQEINRENHKNKEVRKIRRTGNIIAFFLRLRDLLEERPVFFRMKLRVYICYPSQDIDTAQEIFTQLRAINWVEVRLGEEKLGPAREWEKKVKRIIRDTDLVLLCLSSKSILQKGYEQHGFADIVRKVKNKPRDGIYIIPIRLDDFAQVSRFQMWRWLDYFSAHGQSQLFKALQDVAHKFDVIRYYLAPRWEKAPEAPVYIKSGNTQVPNDIFGNYSFVKFAIPSRNYSYWIAKRPVTCIQYERFLKSSDYKHVDYWKDFSKYDEDCVYIGKWISDEIQWPDKFRDGDMSKLDMYHWEDPSFTFIQPNKFVNHISWYEATAYCKWLTSHWREIPEFGDLPGFNDEDISYTFRLPLKIEWVYAVNTGKTLPPGKYPNGDTPPGVVYVPHNFKEWFANLYKNNNSLLSRYYGEMFVDEYLRDMARLGYDSSANPSDTSENNGFRVVAVISKD